MLVRAARLQPGTGDFYDYMASEQLRAELVSCTKEESRILTAVSSDREIVARQDATARRRLLEVLSSDFQELEPFLSRQAGRSMDSSLAGDSGNPSPRPLKPPTLPWSSVSAHTKALQESTQSL
jgi:hypothetical protein